MADKLYQFKGTVYENGYGLIAKSAMKDSELPALAKVIYSYLCSYAGNQGSAFPSRKLMEHELGLNRDTIIKYTKVLIDTGYINLEQVRNKGKFKHNVYYINSQPCMTSSDTVASDTVLSDTVASDTINNSITNNNNTNNKEKDNIPYLEIIEYLNQVAGTNYKTSAKKTKELIRARWNDGFRLADFKVVIEKKSYEWHDDPKMAQYLRPSTLFGTKFEEYLNQKVPQRKTTSSRLEIMQDLYQKYTSGSTNTTEGDDLW